MTASRPDRRPEGQDASSSNPLPRRAPSSSGHAPAPVSRSEQAEAEAAVSEVLAEVREKVQTNRRPSTTGRPGESPSRPGTVRSGAAAGTPPPGRGPAGGAGPAGPAGTEGTTGTEGTAEAGAHGAAGRRTPQGAPAAGAPKPPLRRPGKGLLIAAAAVAVVLACAIPLLVTGGGQGSPTPNAATATSLGDPLAPTLPGASGPSSSPRTSGPSSTGGAKGGHGHATGEPRDTAGPGGGASPAAGRAPSGSPLSQAPSAPAAPPSGPVVSSTPGKAGMVSLSNGQASDQCIDIIGDYGRPDGTKLQLWQCTGADWQLWQFMADGTLRSLANTDKCMDVTGESTAAGATVDWTTCTGSSSEQFTRNQAGNLVNSNAAKCVVPTDGATDNGTLLVLGACGSQPYQKWSTR